MPLIHGGSGVTVDISVGSSDFEKEVVQRSRLHDLGSFKVRLPSIEDLIILKAIACRPKDILDIRSLVEINPGIDAGHIEKKLREFGSAMDTPELWDEIAPLLKPPEN